MTTTAPTIRERRVLGRTVLDSTPQAMGDGTFLLTIIFNRYGAQGAGFSDTFEYTGLRMAAIREALYAANRLRHDYDVHTILLDPVEGPSA